MKRALTIKYDDGANVDVDVAVSFEGESDLMRADVLQAAIEFLQGVYSEACDGAFKGEQESDREKRP